MTPKKKKNYFAQISFSVSMPSANHVCQIKISEESSIIWGFYCTNQSIFAVWHTINVRHLRSLTRGLVFSRNLLLQVDTAKGAGEEWLVSLYSI